MLRLSYYPLTWKFSEIILIRKPSQPPGKVTSYRPIILLPTLKSIRKDLTKKAYSSGYHSKNDPRYTIWF